MWLDCAWCEVRFVGTYRVIECLAFALSIASAVGDLRVLPQSKHPNKSEQEIKAMVHARVKDGGFLGGREWRDVINFMYNEDTSDSIVEGVLRLKHNKARAVSTY